MRMEQTLTVSAYIGMDSIQRLKQNTDSEEQKQRFSQDPDEYLRYRKLVEAELNQRFKFVGLAKQSLYSGTDMGKLDYQWDTRAT